MSEHQRSRLLSAIPSLVIFLLVSILSTPTGSASPWFHKRTLNDSLNRPAQAKILDHDADGDSDVIVCGGFENGMHWFENSGRGQFDEHSIEGIPDAVYLFNFGDLDGDDDFDLILATGENDSVIIFENNGNNEFRHLSNFAFSYCYDIQIGDMDRDGDNDIVLAGRTVINMNYYSIVWLENRNIEFDSVHTIISEGEEGMCYKAHLGDTDDDNDLDIFAEVQYMGGLAYLNYYENDGNGNFPNDMIYWQGGWDFDFGDLDRDGDLDFVLKQFRDELVLSWWENDGEASFEEHVIITFDEGESLKTPILFDIETDGDLDIITRFSRTDERNRIHRYLTWYENDGSQDFTFYMIDTLNHYSEEFTAGDLSSDGYIDIVNYGWEDNFINYYLCSPNRHQPIELALLDPRDRQSYSSEQLSETSFSWEESSDADSLAEVMYYLFELELYHQEDDTLIEHVQRVLNSNSWQGDLSDLFRFDDWEDNFLRINWKVSAISEGDTVECEQPFSIFIPEDVSVDENPYDGIPEEWEISSIYPNPFNPVMQVKIGVPYKGRVYVEIYDILGKRISILCDRELNAGYYQYTWRPVTSSGIYFLQAKSSDGWNETRKLVYLK
ncbi:MAG: T9SS type A sorting domain-containing protein [Candidatus Electryonea clarkiae]|nr:T9SS type A sorting domain-containing protein [Candidatus Electryonea clarkiae]MDP8286421.1 T9SS type A sorting domain-containing protein [Candidatus Electryonea clarkiae]